MKKLLILSVIVMIIFTSCKKIKRVSQIIITSNSIETNLETTIVTPETSESTTTIESVNETTETENSLVSYKDVEENEQDISIDNHITAVNFSEMPDFTNLNELISGYEKKCAIYVQDLCNESAFYYNKDSYFYGASLSKLPFVYNCCLEIGKGNYSLDDKVLYEEGLKYGGTGSLQYSEPGEYYTVQSLMEMVLYNSDNTAYNILCNYFGFDSINNRFNDDGFESKISKDNIFCMVSAEEMAYYWKMVYLNRETSEAFKIANHSAMTSKFSPIRIALNSEKWQVNVESKTGWSENNYHDTGIVLRENPYIIIIMTNSPGDTEDETFLYNVANEVDKIMLKNSNKFE